jgi:hypothetical protein
MGNCFSYPTNATIALEEKSNLGVALRLLHPTFWSQDSVKMKTDKGNTYTAEK